MSATRYVDPYNFTVVHVGLVEHDKAMESLMKAFEGRSTSLAFLKVDPTFDPLRSDHRFQDLLRRMNFP
jgi:hypothetical protein